MDAKINLDPETKKIFSKQISLVKEIFREDADDILNKGNISKEKLNQI